jgi:hypothetical protein
MTPERSLVYYTEDMPSTEPQRWARVQPDQAWQRPGLPRHWCRLFDSHPDSSIGTLPGYGWLETPTKLQHVRLDWLEIRESPPDETK